MVVRFGRDALVSLQADQIALVLFAPVQRKRELGRLTQKIVDDHRCLALPVVAQRQDMAGRVEHLPAASTDFGQFLAQPHGAFCPVEKRRAVRALPRHIDFTMGIGAMVYERANRRVPGREACLGPTRPLHGRARGVPLRQGKIIPHADFVAIAQTGEPGSVSMML